MSVWADLHAAAERLAAAELLQAATHQRSILGSRRAVGDDAEGQFGTLVGPQGGRSAGSEFDVIGVRGNEESAETGLSHASNSSG